MTVDQGQYHILAVKRALQLLNLYSQQGPGLGISDIARHMDIHKSVVHKLLVTMESEDWVYQNPEDGRYYLGLKPLKLSQAVPNRFNFRAAAKRIMEELVEKSQETSTLTILDVSYTSGICIELVECSQSVRHVSEIGREIPLHAGASGLIMAAYMPQDKIEDLLSKPLLKYTPKTITDPHELIKQIDIIRKQGFIYTEGQVDEGLVAIAAPVLNSREELVAGLNISGPVYRFQPEEKLQHLIKLVKKSAQRLSDNLRISGATTV